MLRLILALALAAATALPAAAQSTAINGSIEGVVTDESGAVLPGVTVTVVNLDTGDSRVVGHQRQRAVPRAAAAARASYRVSAELQGFKKFEQTGINISAGQTAVISVKMGVGELSETISVTADAPLVDLSRIEGGRTLTEAEIKTLPLTSRNPYNFALLQPGVVGFENSGVRRAAPHHQRRAAARQLSDRRQQQHPEGPRRPAPDADVGGDDPRSEGGHHRLRAGVRPDHGPHLQRDHALGHQHLQGPGQLPLPARGDGRLPVLLPGPAHRRDQAADRRQRPHRGYRAARSSATAPTSSAATSTPSATCRAPR